MKVKRFGTTDLMVSEIGFGCARLGGIFQHSSQAESIRTVRLAVDHGITFFDTADMYCQGESETVLGTALRSDRARMIIASKVGYRLPRQRSVAARLKPVLRPLIRRIGIKRENLPHMIRGTISQDFTRGYILRAVEGSLARLKTDYLDLYQLHSPPAGVLQDGEVFETLDRLRDAGKIRYYGVSCETAEDALVCLRYPGVASLQIRLSLLDRQALREAIPHAAAQGVAVIGRECFAGGLLTRAPDALGLEDCISDPDDRETKRGEIADYAKRAAQCDSSLARLALHFVLKTEGISTTLLGRRTSAHVLDNLASLETPPRILGSGTL
jgi:aryl-alcohol dehydrogenase-like predicted oxidoreductase